MPPHTQRMVGDGTAAELSSIFQPQSKEDNEVHSAMLKNLTCLSSRPPFRETSMFTSVWLSTKPNKRRTGGSVVVASRRKGGRKKEGETEYVSVPKAPTDRAAGLPTDLANGSACLATSLLLMQWSDFRPAFLNRGRCNSGTILICSRRHFRYKINPASLQGS